MTKQLSKSATSVQNVLDSMGLTCTVLELPSSTRTASDAASSLDCDVAQIVKSLIFKTKKTQKPILVLASGANQVDLKTIEGYVGESVTKADADFVRDVTGFAIGGIPPIGHKNTIDFTFIDQDLMSLDDLWAAAGTPRTVFCMRSQDLIKATRGTVISLSLRA